MFVYCRVQFVEIGAPHIVAAGARIVGITAIGASIASLASSATIIAVPVLPQLLSPVLPQYCLSTASSTVSVRSQ